jgi:multidrug resistance protein MdtO
MATLAQSMPQSIGPSEDLQQLNRVALDAFVNPEHFRFALKGCSAASVFDQLWGNSAAAERKRTFISNLRLLAQFAREPLSRDPGVAAERSDSPRERLGVLFEFGSSRQRDLLLRSHIRQWQPQLCVMRIASLKYRLQLPGFELPEAVRLSRQEYDSSSALMLEGMADQLEGKLRQTKATSDHSFELLQQRLQAWFTGQPEQLAEPRVRSFRVLLGRIDVLTSSLREQIATEAN